MICDGYNIDGMLSIGGDTIRFLYRPMLSQERAQFLQAFRGWSEGAASVEKCLWLDRHLVAVDGGYRCYDIYSMSKESFRLLHHILAGVAWGGVEPDWNDSWEHKDVENLRKGLRTRGEFPHLEIRSCADCLKYEWDADSLVPLTIGGVKQIRPVGIPPLCKLNEGCPVGTPENPIGRLTPRNRRAFQHHRLCAATGNFPDDPIVARNALVIEETLQEIARERGDVQLRRNGGRSIPVVGGRRTAASVAAGDSPFFFLGDPEL